LLGDQEGLASIGRSSKRPGATPAVLVRSTTTPRLHPLPLVATGLALVTAATALVARTLRGRYLRVAVAGDSMTPALLPEDFLVLRAGAPRPHDAIGQIVAVRDPRSEGDGRVLLKRIVGAPGDSLRVGG